MWRTCERDQASAIKRQAQGTHQSAQRDVVERAVGKRDRVEHESDGEGNAGQEASRHEHACLVAMNSQIS